MAIKKYNTIDLFAGCGGLMDGFMQEGSYNTLACVEWESFPCQTIANRLAKKWHHRNANEEVIRFDIQRTEELINGFDDPEYGKHQGLAKLVGENKVDVIIGGPPCQAYSLAGRIRDPHGMREDYRNYLFESYIRILNHFKPSLFVFENVMGMLSAAPDGTPIVDKIREAFDKAGYLVIDDFKDAVFDVDNVLCKKILDEFYNVLMPLYKKKAKPRTVRSAIGDMPAIFPRKEVLKKEGHKYSHQPIDGNGMMNHIPRFHSERDQKIFTMLAEDIESGRNQYVSTDSLKELYTKMTGKKSNIHKYYVLRWNEPSNTIPAHLYKDGMRHIHPDPAQARSITVREAARLQTFADDFEFLGPMMAQYKMIGNAVPSDFAKIIAKGVKEIMTKYL